MITEFSICPKDKCPLDYLAEMKGETVGAWIFLHDSCIERLQQTANEDYTENRIRHMSWNATEKWAATDLELDYNPKLVWNLVYNINAPDIAFKEVPSTPRIIYYIKMQE